MKVRNEKQTLQTSAFLMQDADVAKELTQRGLSSLLGVPAEEQRRELVADIAEDPERDAIRDAAAFVDGVRRSCHPEQNDWPAKLGGSIV